MAKVHELERRRVGVNVSLDLGLLTRLDAAAKRAGASRSALLRRLLNEALTDAEAEEAALMTEEGRRREELEDEGLLLAREEALAEEGEDIPLAQVKARLGL
jgi:hypothetical protein